MEICSHLPVSESHLIFEEDENEDEIAGDDGNEMPAELDPSEE